MAKIEKILVANRGEIACRVIRAARDMGIGSVAVYSDVDSDALHVRMADEAVAIGPAQSSESYLRGEKIIEAAKATGANAIHPGYGFLSENAGFVREATNEGLIFIGPSPEAMELMGGKISARKLAIDAEVPVVPGTTKPLESADEALEVAAEFGYPVMLKASAGGGGKGMRLVEAPEDLPGALSTAKSESLAAFGDDSVYLEKAVVRPRHIEIQVFGDSHGNYVYLGERECSIQRRHQKVVEESPSPINDPVLREKMGIEAVKVARAVNYVGAGTVEFLVSDVDRSFYFLEMNTRLQVEHPVTELVTGFDLVREQIRVAEGCALSFSQNDVSIRGHAIECRVYAEDPENNYLPSPGKITRLRVPTGNGIRDDGGVYEGAEVSIYYDPMISKLCTYGRDRSEAIDRMKRALREYTVGGIKTTIPLFRQIMEDPVFVEGNLDTGFLTGFAERKKTPEPDRNLEELASIAAAMAFCKPKSETAAIATPVSKWLVAARSEGVR
ncbi:MAG: acetyl-CoA carboxylase biotin carboxylase subunit [Pyrinomonadaceae bacterium]